MYWRLLDRLLLVPVGLHADHSSDTRLHDTKYAADFSVSVVMFREAKIDVRFIEGFTPPDDRASTVHTREPRQVDCSKQYFAKHRARLAWKYTAVESPKQNGRHALVHVTEAGTVGAVARGVMKGEQKTLCGQRLHGAWKVVPRDEDHHGFLISCPICRSKIDTVIVLKEA